MADIIPPRRGEPIVGPSGVPTLRFLEYLERTATQTTETIVDTEIDATSINLAVGQVSALSDRIRDMEILTDLHKIEAGRV